MLEGELYKIQHLLTLALSLRLQSAAAPALLQGQLSPYGKPVGCAGKMGPGIQLLLVSSRQLEVLQEAFLGQDEGQALLAILDQHPHHLYGRALGIVLRSQSCRDLQAHPQLWLVLQVNTAADW